MKRQILMATVVILGFGATLHAGEMDGTVISKRHAQIRFSQMIREAQNCGAKTHAELASALGLALVGPEVLEAKQNLAQTDSQNPSGI